MSFINSIVGSGNVVGRGSRVSQGDRAKLTNVHGQSFTINGQEINVPDGASITVENGTVRINGKVHSEVKDQIINIVMTGTADSVSTASGNISIHGDCGSCQNTSGNVEVSGNVNGSISNISGDVAVKGGVKGSVKTVSGDIRK